MDKFELSTAQVAEMLGQTDVEAFKGNFVADGKPLEQEAAFAKLKALNAAEYARVHTEGSTKGKRERMSEFETNIRTKFGYTGTQQGEALIESLMTLKEADIQKLKTQLEATAGKKLDAFTPEEAESFIKNSKFFQDKIAETQGVAQTWEQKHNDLAASYQKANLDSAVKQKAIAILDDMKPVLGDDATKASNLKALFLQSLGGINFKLNEQGEIVVLDSSGNPAKDDKTFRDVLFADVVKAQANTLFNFQLQDPKGNAGNAGSAGSVSVPKNVEELHIAIANAKTPEERAALRTAFGQ